MVSLKASTMLLLCTCVAVSSADAANSNHLVSRNHRSAIKEGGGGLFNNNYCSGLNVFKSSSSRTNPYNNGDGDDELEENEYVTSFYRQKREKRRELAAAANRYVSQNGGNCRLEADHSLDHCFDHDTIVMQNDNDDCSGSNNKRAVFRRNSSDGGGSYDGSAKKSVFLPPKNNKKQHARVASSVRGGSIATQQVRNKHSNNNNGSSNKSQQQHHHSRKNRRGSSSRPHPSATFAPYRSRSHSHQYYQRHHDNIHEESRDTDELAKEECEEEDCHTNNEQDDGNSVAPPIHQANLLRVPCSLRLNSDEDHHVHQHYSTSSYISKTATSSTPIAAYVDTGAQVTVISAAAARKVGILHLMDRRYAGRATGVGHCRILGRIPAGCVQFMLGRRQEGGNCEEGEDDDDGSMIQMNGPALTVLEGTVTEGVDMLLGLDVLQDWEATIQMGGSARQSSIAVKKRGMSEPVVLPFLVGGGPSKGSSKERRRSGGGATDAATRHGQQGRRRQQYQQHTAANNKAHHHGRRHQRNIQLDIAEEDDSPVSSDIESDLDMLDQSEFTHEFPDEGRRRVKQCNEKIVHDIEREDELLGIRHYSHHFHDGKERRSKEECDDDNDDEFLRDSSDEDEEVLEEDFDMSGL